MELIKALVKAQENMPYAEKTGYNKHLKSYYSTFKDIHTAVVPALNAQGIYFYQVIEPHQVTTFFARGDQTISTACPIRVAENADMQKFGSGVTYAKRYGLMALSGSAVEDDESDDDGEQAKLSPPPTPVKVDAREIAQTFARKIALSSLEGLTKAGDTINANVHLSDAQRLWLAEKIMARMNELQEAAPPAEDWDAPEYEPPAE